ncbi:heme ABC transporter ATP-binding protein [Paracoccus versutus]|uniref:heme ABC transporter ATP-binding protein n=1 Tax=Paracoccus sp. pheM1 TaxID=2831675 RepID=UPI00091929A1|nr:heme ABC transporter ATP-binding protein [Paracoccus versutus]MBT0782120.1 heme ABC transporter ATP-binding protein [Paracoccus sp. pheM1]RDD71680.1 heme ABC transporter ATP-binding protein [Paracoccus versutus]WGR63412.1 heme ABC transporter ATP-binding protein [Paracoccus ferrooxidans]SFY41173.1 iron complex transport system ATP-binding protein [Paracoccus pantotrophus]
MSLIASDIQVSLGRKQILHGVSVEARAGEITAIVGPNGSGKTTLMRSLTGELACRGAVTLNGHDIAALSPEELARRRAVLPQAAALSFPFTVAEVVRIGVEARGERADALVPAALAAVDLPGFSGRLYQELSGGEQQRVQLARVLAQVWQPLDADGPRWLMLDEPVSSLDIAHQLTVMRLAADYARAGGGVVAVMHDLNLTALFAQKLVLMSGGRVLCQGRPDEVLTDEALSSAYGCRLRVNAVPDSGIWVLPHAAA